MSEAATPRLALDYLQPGQAQKELTHNEALARLDILVQPAVRTCGDNGPPPTPAIGQTWIIGSAPTGAWAGQAHAIAAWSDGGWRFVAPLKGMSAWVSEDATTARYTGSAWEMGRLRGHALMIDGVQLVGARAPAIANAAGGTTVDAEARAAVAAILAMLRGHGLIAT